MHTHSVHHLLSYLLHLHGQSKTVITRYELRNQRATLRIALNRSRLLLYSGRFIGSIDFCRP